MLEEGRQAAYTTYAARYYHYYMLPCYDYYMLPRAMTVLLFEWTDSVGQVRLSARRKGTFGLDWVTGLPGDEFDSHETF